MPTIHTTLYFKDVFVFDKASIRDSRVWWSRVNMSNPLFSMPDTNPGIGRCFWKFQSHHCRKCMWFLDRLFPQTLLWGTLQHKWLYRIKMHFSFCTFVHFYSKTCRRMLNLPANICPNVVTTHFRITDIEHDRNS